MLTIMPSKESCIAKLYRETVYCPFIMDIRKSQYNYDESEPIPDNLQVVLWMDVAHVQLKLLTDEESLKKESELKITVNKHSAASDRCWTGC